MAAEASAISSASPAAKTARPNSRALCEELVDGIEPDGDEQGVAVEGPFGAGDRAEPLVDPGDGDGLDGVPAIGADDGMRGVDRHAQPGQLVPVDLVAAALGHGLDETDHGDAGLQGVVAGDEPDVAASDDEQPAGRPDEVPVDEGLERAGPVDAGEGVARKGQVLLPRPRGHQEDFRIDQDVGPALDEDADLPVAEDRQGRALEPDPDGRERTDLGLEPGGDVDAPGPGEDGLDGAEEAVGLQDELAAEAVLVVDEDGRDAAPAELDRGREPGRAAADDQNGDTDGLDRLGRDPGRGPGVDPGQLGQAFHGLHADAGPDELHARLDGNAVGEDETLGALAVGAEDALGRAVLGVVAEDAHAGGEERG